MADSRPDESASSSAFVAMRSAWNVFLAGWPERRAAAGTAPGDDGGKIGGVVDRSCIDDGAGDPSGISLFPVPSDEVAEIVTIESIDELPCTRRSIGAHAHIDRAAAVIRESSFGCIDLMR